LAGARVKQTARAIWNAGRAIPWEAAGFLGARNVETSLLQRGAKGESDFVDKA